MVTEQVEKNVKAYVPNYKKRWILFCVCSTCEMVLKIALTLNSNVRYESKFIFLYNGNSVITALLIKKLVFPQLIVLALLGTKINFLKMYLYLIDSKFYFIDQYYSYSSTALFWLLHPFIIPLEAEKCTYSKYFFFYKYDLTILFFFFFFCYIVRLVGS